jgi:hypothetical protein
MMRIGMRLDTSATRLSAGGLAVIGAGVVWYGLLMRPIWAAAAYGPICSHASLLGPHCPSCFAALALIGAGLALLAAGQARRNAVAARRAS